MIYEHPNRDSAIRQGDIFVRVPRIDFSLQELLLLGDQDGADEQTTWAEVLERGKEQVTFAVAARPVSAIVITQDCDTIRAQQITLCEIRRLEDVVSDLGSTPKKFINNVRSQSKKNLKWFYLPPDPRLGFESRMAVDFQMTITIPRQDLEHLRSHRAGRLNAEADEHFRERLAEFFRRYPVDEWYPFNKEEFEQYRSDVDPSATPRPYQS